MNVLVLQLHEVNKPTLHEKRRENDKKCLDVSREYSDDFEYFYHGIVENHHIPTKKIMFKIFGFKGGSTSDAQKTIVTPPSSENGDAHEFGRDKETLDFGFPVDLTPAVNIDVTTDIQVGEAATPSRLQEEIPPSKDSITSPTYIARPITPPSPPTSLKSRRVSREANRSKKFTTRQRSTTETSSSSTDLPARKRRPIFNNQPANNLGAQEGLKAVEPIHDPKLGKMAYAEQQQWITVQQKTFTKWLNTKIEPRDLVVKDLVKDLGDGVSAACWEVLLRANTGV